MTYVHIPALPIPQPIRPLTRTVAFADSEVQVQQGIEAQRPSIASGLSAFSLCRILVS